MNPFPSGNAMNAHWTQCSLSLARSKIYCSGVLEFWFLTHQLSDCCLVGSKCTTFDLWILFSFEYKKPRKEVELRQLALSLIHCSESPIIGTEQNSTAFWTSIYNHWISKLDENNALFEERME